MGSKAFKSILKQFANGATEPVEPRPEKVRQGSWLAKHMTPEQRTAYRARAHKALREGLTVFMSKDTVAAFSRILKTPATSAVMRKLLEEIGNGTLTIIGAGCESTANKPITTYAGGRRVLPTVLSIDQLSGGMPLSLKQAAKILNVTPNKLYFRCVTGRIHFEKDRSRYFIPANEVARLQVIGL